MTSCALGVSGVMGRGLELWTRILTGC